MGEAWERSAGCAMWLGRVDTSQAGGRRMGICVALCHLRIIDKPLHRGTGLVCRCVADFWRSWMWAVMTSYELAGRSRAVHACHGCMGCMSDLNTPHELQ